MRGFPHRNIVRLDSADESREVRLCMASLGDSLAALRTASSCVLTGMRGTAPAYLLARYTQSSTTHTVLCITPDAHTATACAEDIAFFSDGALVPQLFPSLEPPYQSLPSVNDVKIERLATLLALVHDRCRIVVAPIAALQQRVPPPTLFRNVVQTLHTGTVIARDALVSWLQESGYAGTPLVEDTGTMAVRGHVIDCWPVSERQPLRIEFDDDTVASLRHFDPSSQRSHHPCEVAILGPADTLLYTEVRQREALRQLKARADAADIPVKARQALVHALQHRLRPPLLEHLLPLFYAHPATLIDYLSPHTLVALCDPQQCAQQAREYLAQVDGLAMQAPEVAAIVPPQDIAVSWASLTQQWHGFTRCELGEAVATSSATVLSCPTDATAQLRTRYRLQRGHDPMTPIAEFLREQLTARQRIAIVCHTTLAAERTLDLLRWHGLAVGEHRAEQSHAIHIVVGQLSAGFHSPADGLLFLTEPELFGEKIRRHAPQRPSIAGAYTSFQDLAEGDIVVHEHHGIGRYAGLVTMALPATAASDFLQLEYLGGDKLYLPVYRLSQLQRYIGPGDGLPPLDRLGGTRWKTIRKKVLHSIRVMAQELLKIYAARKVHHGIAFSGRDHHLEEFEATFPYDETPDQWRAIEDTLADMQSEQPMDRLICGDVGYGKTEVAMRSAFRAAMDGRQVALLCPTTLLAFQHYHTFTARFAHTALRIELLSRFRTKEEQKAAVVTLAAGTVDIVIGTHRLLQRDIAIPRLGLLIIDEEQRFGVAHKERLRKLRETVDTLSLSATPIPRTLHMSMSGLRDVSIIQTPPADRHAVRTYIVPFDDRLIREAVEREVARGGQIFFVHNRVQTILAMRDHLQRLVPTARIAVAHGQMAEEDLEHAMEHFITRAADLLLCTSIIEAGLDIPAANTLIVNRADTFGLAQLYQIRGRVGRSNVQACAYLLIPPHADVKDGSGLTAVAARRLATLARYTELGSGFSIALHDLEMRGAGNLLGAQQSGHIAEVGYELFARLLERTIRQLQGEPIDEELDPEITIPFSARLPEAYIGDPNLRVAWYKRLASCTTDTALEAAEAELVDCFGALPEATSYLLQVIRLRLAAVALKLETVHVQEQFVRLKFHPSTHLSGAQLCAYVAQHPTTHQLRPDGTVHIRLPHLPAAELFRVVHQELRQLPHL